MQLDLLYEKIFKPLKALSTGVLLLSLSIIVGILFTLPLYLLASGMVNEYKIIALILIVLPLLSLIIVLIVKNLKRFLRFTTLVLPVMLPVFFIVGIIPAVGIGFVVHYFGTNYTEEYKLIVGIALVLLFAGLLIKRLVTGWAKTHNLLQTIGYFFSSWVKILVYFITVVIGLPYALSHWYDYPVVAIPATIVGIIFIILITNINYIFSLKNDKYFMRRSTN